MLREAQNANAERDAGRMKQFIERYGAARIIGCDGGNTAMMCLIRPQDIKERWGVEAYLKTRLDSDYKTACRVYNEVMSEIRHGL